jgi:hypothetical protein
MRRSTVQSLPVQLVFPDLTLICVSVKQKKVLYHWNLESHLTAIVCKIIDDPATDYMIQKKVSSEISSKLEDK